MDIIRQAHELLKNQPFDYAICGGCAIDLFLGEVTRPHGDLDILVYWPQRDTVIRCMNALGYAVYEMLGNGKAHHITDIADQRRWKRNIICVRGDCGLVSLAPTDEPDVVGIAFRHGTPSLQLLEFLFNDRTDTEFLYARDHRVRRNLTDALLFRDGIPYLAPELCLLYKSTDTERESNQHDLRTAFPRLHPSQQAWLRHALRTVYPRAIPGCNSATKKEDLTLQTFLFSMWG